MGGIPHLALRSGRHSPFAGWYSLAGPKRLGWEVSSAAGRQSPPVLLGGIPLFAAWRVWEVVPRCLGGNPLY